MTKVLHLTNHRGTKKNINAIFEQLDIQNQLINENCYNDYYISKERSNNIFNEYKDKIKEYKFLLFTDISMFARPFLENIDNHDCILIIYITNRFDWGMFGFIDEEYIELYFSLSKHPRVIFCSDNTYDQYYATIHNIHFLYSEPIKLTPLLINYISVHSKDKFFIYDRGTDVNYYKVILDEYEIPYEIFGEKYQPYRDVEHICEYKGIIHLPYQTNIQSLWENLGYNIIYFIPSKKYLKDLIKNTYWYYWEEKNKDEELLEKSVELAEWYLPEHECLFEYFDNWSELKEKFENYTQEKIIWKKNMIATFMEKNNNKNLAKWKNILQ
jgi:hypothetical protein